MLPLPERSAGTAAAAEAGVDIDDTISSLSQGGLSAGSHRRALGILPRMDGSTLMMKFEGRCIEGGRADCSAATAVAPRFIGCAIPAIVALLWSICEVAH